VFDLSGSEHGTIANYVARTGGVVSGCLSGILSDAYALRLVFFQTAGDIETVSRPMGT
jgi:hypothetical protein